MRSILIILFIAFFVNNAIYPKGIIATKFSNYDRISMKMTARCVETFRNLYGDSLLYEFIESMSYCVLVVDVSFDGKKICNIESSYPFFTNMDKDKIKGKEELYIFMEKHKYEIVKSLFESYAYMYTTCHHRDYLSWLRIMSIDDNYRKTFGVVIEFPACGPFAYQVYTMSPAEYVEYVSRYEYSRIKTSIDDGITPESYIWYINMFRKIYGYDDNE